MKISIFCLGARYFNYDAVCSANYFLFTVLGNSLKVNAHKFVKCASMEVSSELLLLKNKKHSNDLSLIYDD